MTNLIPRSTNLLANFTEDYCQADSFAKDFRIQLSRVAGDADDHFPAPHEEVPGGTVLPVNRAAASQGAAAKTFSPKPGSMTIAQPESDITCHDGPLFAFANVPPPIAETTLNSLYAVKYVSPRARPLAFEEAAIRHTAYALKRSSPGAIATAAPAMAALIRGPCWLIPIPASDGSLTANLALARAIAALVPGARLNPALRRSRPVESSTSRRRRGEFGLTPAEHHIIRTGGPMAALPVYFVDNVITTGNTLRAARAALGWGTGLAYADASTRENTLSLFTHMLTQRIHHENPIEIQSHR